MPPTAAATSSPSAPPKRRVLGGISTTTSNQPAPSSSSSSTSPNPSRVLRPGVSASASYRPPSSQGRPLSTSTLSPPTAASSSSSPRIRAKVDLANIVSSTPSSSAASSVQHGSAGTSGRSSPLKVHAQRTPVKRTGSTSSIHTAGLPPRIHLSGSTAAAAAAAAPSSPISTRSNSIISNSHTASAYLSGAPSPNVTIRTKHRNQSVDLGNTSASSSLISSSARIPSSLTPGAKVAPASPQSHRRISSSSMISSTAFPPRDNHPHHNSISPPSSSVSSTTSSTRRAHVVIGPSSTSGIGNGSGIKVVSPTLAEHPPPSISLATPYESPVLRYDQLPSTAELSPKTGHPPFSTSPTSLSNSNHDPFFPRQRTSTSSLSAPNHITNLPSITHELQQQAEASDPQTDARVAAAVAAIDAKKERKMLDLQITNKSLLAINANLEKERLKMSKEMRELRRKTAIAAAAAASGTTGSSAFGSGIGGFIALLRGGRKHSADGSESATLDGNGLGDDAGTPTGELGPADDEEYWLHAAMAELTDGEDGPSDDDDASMRDDLDDDDDDAPYGDNGEDTLLDGEEDDADDVIGNAGSSAIDDRRQRARQRALAERKVAQLVHNWQTLDAAHTRCRSLVEDMLLRGRLACKLSLGPDQHEIVEEGSAEGAGAEGAAVVPVPDADTGTAEQADLSAEGQPDSTPEEDTSVGTDSSHTSSSTSSSTSTSTSSTSLPPPTLVLPGDDDVDVDEDEESGELDNSDARSDISSKTERAPEAVVVDEGDLSSGSGSAGDTHTRAESSVGDISLD
ncbi:hypothetical protein A4X03_0g2 [Tilletia caries]|uniref:Uncharacterized protein n=1 Tax=Tilletia caries TaxID=13290 RepID=A0A8T8TUM7_9BASI|nr:hypothetical protein A4X03_0g2 [Tilletia caries]